jgi:hypothetical protein
MTSAVSITASTPKGTALVVPLAFERTTLARMDSAAAIVVVLLLALVPVVAVGGMFVWAALRDGEEDRALQARLGIRRRTRLGR